LAEKFKTLRAEKEALSGQLASLTESAVSAAADVCGIAKHAELAASNTQLREEVSGRVSNGSSPLIRRLTEPLKVLPSL